jgi:hypothetical protein
MIAPHSSITALRPDHAAQYQMFGVYVGCFIPDPGLGCSQSQEIRKRWYIAQAKRFLAIGAKKANSKKQSAGCLLGLVSDRKDGRNIRFRNVSVLVQDKSYSAQETHLSVCLETGLLASDIITVCLQHLRIFRAKNTKLFLRIHDSFSYRNCFSKPSPLPDALFTFICIFNNPKSVAL